MSHGAIRLEDTAMKLSEVFERAAMKPENDDMALPAGKSCADCTNFMRCVAFIGVRHINAEQHRCDWAPSRFRPRTEGCSPKDFESDYQTGVWAVMRSLGLIDYPSSGRVVALPILFLESK